ncbi:MAG: hypothetical protein KDI56_16005, partial [Xanthomonadales bacterium]|nr:hypothetical protein [Xanthomonadales bacterium]
PARGPVTLLQDEGRWIRRDHGDESVRVLPVPWCAGGSPQTQIDRLEIRNGLIDRVALTLPEPANLPDTEANDLLEGAGIRWRCEIRQHRVVDCRSVGDSYHPPASKWAMRLRGDRLSALAGRPLADIDFELHSIKPTLRIESDHEALDGFQLLVLAPLALDADRLFDALVAKVDGQVVGHRLNAVPPPPPTTRDWTWTHPWPGPDGPHAMSWQAPAKLAWSLQLEPAPTAGQHVEIWLSGALTSPEGPLSGPGSDAHGLQVYEWQIPETLSIDEHRPSYPQEVLPGLVFSRPPVRRTIVDLIQQLPAGLSAYPELLTPLPDSDRSGHAPRWRLPLIGRPSQSALLRWRRGHGTLGERLAAGELALQLPEPANLWDR